MFYSLSFWYRLMMRRCMESGNCQFGMVLSPDSKYGTMLRINSFNQMPDGRSVRCKYS